MGYPFDSLVPSYATTLGASADRPIALAELMGIIINGGVRKPTQRIDSLHFAKDTPYETLVKRSEDGKGEQVLNPQVARAVANAIRGVVQEGTAKRVKQAFYKQDGSVIALGGKTGTGDQRFDVYGAGHRLIESRYVNRSATFVFNIGERFFGSMTAYVHGPESAHYDFTSALPVQLLVTLAPSLMPMIEKQDTVTVPGLHVVTAAEKAAAAAAAGNQLTDDVATVKPAPEDAQAEEVTVPAKPAAQPVAAAPGKSAAAVKPAAKADEAAPAQHKPAADAGSPQAAAKPAVKPAAKPAAEPAHAKPAREAAAHAKPEAGDTPHHKPAADADAARAKAAGEGVHPKAVDALRAKASAAPRAKPRSEDQDQPKPEPVRPKPAAVEEVLH
jgi:membrane peptidoglycan carboxypeptidase